ncbi:hypothetical protein C8R44DRAFT_260129 [Mycena epipterygia]|nr:hypothetical protein C8R44DRAFT_260129 [Mycena epipterygia]
MLLLPATIIIISRRYTGTDSDTRECGTHQIPTPPLQMAAKKPRRRPQTGCPMWSLARDVPRGVLRAVPRGSSRFVAWMGAGALTSAHENSERASESNGHAPLSGMSHNLSQSNSSYRTPPVSTAHTRRPRAAPILVPRRAGRAVWRAPHGARGQAVRKAAGKDVGMWFGPSSAASAIRMLVDVFPVYGLVSVPTDGTGKLVIIFGSSTTAFESCCLRRSSPPPLPFIREYKASVVCPVCRQSRSATPALAPLRMKTSAL